MPFKVTYKLYEPGKTVPCLTTEDRRIARCEYNDMLRKRGYALSRLVPTVTPVEPLTKPEKYLYLVFEVRCLQREYFNHGRNQEVFRQALEKEKQLDNWNARTRFHLQGHPKCKPDDEKAFAFFEVVEKWRDVWCKYFAYKKRSDKDPTIEREMKKQCFDFEKIIDEYITKTIGI